MATTYSNPRLCATISDWPHGGKRVTAVFTIETHATRGQRAIRTTTGAPKVLTFAKAARIVDGDDGKTYIAELSQYEIITIMNGNMKYQAAVIFKDDPRFADLMALFT